MNDTRHNKHRNEQAIEILKDAQILFDEADDVAVPTCSCHCKMGIYLISPSGYVTDPSKIDRAVQRLKDLGFKVKVDKHAADRHLRFAGTDEQRAKAFSRAAKSKADIVMVTRGGYGLTRILDLIDWKLLKKYPKKYIGYSDFTAFNLALLAKTGMVSYTGPSAAHDFGGDVVDELNAELFVETMHDELEILSFESPDSDPVDVRGTLWGGNLALVTALVGTPYMPKVKKGILFLEDVAEHPYRIERMLTQLYHAGILQQQKAIVLGEFTDYTLTDFDNGFNMDQVVQWLRDVVKVPVVRGLPYGHGAARITLPIGQKVGLATQDGMAYLQFKEHDHDDHDHHHDEEEVDWTAQV